MSTQIDERVVAMKFDARDFDNNVRGTMALLDKFKASLKLDGAKKGFEDLGNAADKVSLKHLEDSASAVGEKFNTMSIVAISAINNIVNTAMNAGKQIVKSLTIDQVTAGFTKYEEKVKAVQTIMNATGSSIDEVNAQLDRLTWFTDETSYSFSDMVNNVGKFTSYNVPLDKAVTAMQGIANWAAISGQGIGEASRVMYNLSQALGKGFVQVQDWSSVENANMATQELKETVIESAVALGVLRKEGERYIAVNGGYEVSATKFRDTLTEGWFTTDVLMAALGKYGEYADAVFKRVQETGESCAEAMEHVSTETMDLGARAFKAGQEAKTFTDAIEATKDAVSTGWMRTFEMLFGNYEEAKDLWTELAGELYEIFAAGGDERNAMLKSWTEMGGRVQLIATVKAAYGALLSVVTPLKEAIDEMFPPMTAERLRVMIVHARSLFNAFKLGEKEAYTLKAAMKMLLIPVKAVATAFEIVIVFTTTLIKVLATLTKSFLKMLATTDPIEDAFKNLFGDERYTRLMESMATIATNIGNAFKYIKDQIVSLISKAKTSTKLTQAIEKIAEILGPIAEFVLDAIVDGIEMLANLDFSDLDSLGRNTLEIIRSKLSDIFGIVTDIGSKIGEYFGVMNGFKAPLETISTLEGSFLGLNTTISDFKSSFNLDNILKNTDGVATTLGNVISGLGDSIGRMTERLGPAQILLFAFGTALTGTLLSAMNAFKGISTLTTNFGMVVKNFADRLKPNKITTVAKALVLLAGALLLLSLVDADRLAQATISMAALAVILGLLTAAMAGLDNILKDNSQINKIGTAMTQLSIALLVMASAMNILSKTELDGILPKVVALGVIIGALGGMSILMAKFAPQLSTNGWVLIAYALAINTVIGALQKLEKLDTSGLLGRMGALLTIMGLLGVMAATLKNVKFSGALGVTLMIGNMFILMEALKKMAEFPMGTVLNALPMYLSCVLLIGGLMEASARSGRNAAKAGVFIVAAAASLIIIGEAIRNIGELDTKVAVQGGIIVSLMLGIITTLTKMTKFVGPETDKLSKGLVMMSISIMLLGVCISYLGALDIKQAAQGTIVVSALLAVFALITKMNSTILKDGEKLKGGAANIIAMAALIGTMASALALLTLLPSDNLMNAALSLAAAMLGVGAAVKLMANMNFKGAVGTAFSMLALMGAVALIMSAIAGIDTDATIITKAVAISIMLTAIAGAVRILPELGVVVGKDGYLVLAELTLIMGALAGVLYLINGIDPVGAIANATALSGMLLALVTAVRLLPSFVAMKWDNIGKALIAFTVCLGYFAFILTQMNGLDPVNSIANAVALSTMLLALAAAVRILPTFTYISKEELIAIGLLAGAMGLFAILLYGLNGMDPVNNLANAVALSVLIMALSASTRLLPEFTKFDWEKVAAALIELEVAMAGLALILKLIDLLDIDVNMPAVIALSVLTVALAGAVRILNGFTEFNFLAAIQAIGAVAILIGGIMTALYLIKDMDWSGVENGIQAFAAAGKAIGSFVGGIVSGLISAGLSFLPDIGTYLSQFIENCFGFVEGIKKVDSSVLKGATYLAETILLLTGAELIQGIVGFLPGISNGSPLISFGQQLADFGPYMMKFADSVSGMDSGKVMVISNAVKALAEAYSLINTGILDGIADAVFGDDSLSRFGEDLAAFGPYFAEFANSLGDVDQAALEATIAAAKCMAEFESALPKHGGWAQTILGDATLGEFGENLVIFGDAIVAFNAAITKQPGLDVDAINKSAEAGKALATLENNLRGHGGALQQFFGDATLDTFGSNLESFGQAMMAYSAAITVEPGLDIAAIKESAKAGEALAELEKGLVGTNGTWQSIFGGNQTLGNFSQNLGAFGYALYVYSGYMNQIGDFSKIRESKDVAELFSTLEAALPEDSGIFKWFDGKQDFGDFGKNLTSLGESLVKYQESISSVDLTRFSESIDQLQRLVDMGGTINSADIAALNTFPQVLRNIASAGISDFIEEFQTAEAIMADAVNTVLNNVETSITTYSSFSGIGTDIVTEIKNGIIQNESGLTVRGQDIVGFILMGISSQHDNLTSQGAYLITCILSGMQSQQSTLNYTIESTVATALKHAREGTRIYDLGKEVGQYAISGIIAGINSQQKRLEETMANTSQMMIDTSKAVLDEHSPSVEFNIIGKNVVEGLAEGIEQNQDELEEVMTTMNKDILEQAEQDWDITSNGSGVMRNKIGVYLVKGIADGIYTDTSAEEAATKKAQNIVNAFQTGLARLQTLSDISSAEYGLWESTEGKGATSTELLSKQVEDYETRLALEGRSVMSAIAEYQTMLETFGENSDEERSAYLKLLQAKQSFVDLGNEYLDLINGNTEDMTGEVENAAYAYQDAARLYGEFLSEFKERLVTQGYSDEDIDQMARSYSGFDPMQGATTNKRTIQDLMETYIGDVEIEIDAATAVAQQRVENSLSSGIRSGTSSGMASGVQAGVADATPDLQNSGSTAADEMIKGYVERMNDAGGEIDNSMFGSWAWSTDMNAEGLRKGLETIKSIAVDEITNAAESGLKAWDGVTGSHSPSREMIKRGEFLVEGLQIGIAENEYKVFESGIAMGQAVIDGVTSNDNGIGTLGSIIAMQIIDGINQSSEEISIAIQMVLDTSLQTVTSYSYHFVEVGTQLADSIIDGLIDGVRNRQAEAINEVVQLATQMYQAAASALGIGGSGMSLTMNTATNAIGMATSGGYNGLRTFTDEQRELLNQLEYAVQNGEITSEEYWARKGDLGITPVYITPVISYDNLPDEPIVIQATTSLNQAAGISSTMNAQRINQNNQNGTPGKDNSGVSYNFYQTNNSPKALSRIDIYRDTHNLLSSAKGV